MSRPITVLCVGDIFGEPGRRAVTSLLPRAQKQHEADLAIVNVENAGGRLRRDAAHRRGPSSSTAPT